MEIQKKMNEQRLAISVIIPVYNVEDYLHQCIHSLLSQKIEIEIILINDGSTDQSVNIIDMYQANYKNVITIHQENRGVSAARNRGISMAQGDYVIFLDSDDWLSDNSLSSLYTIAKANDADIVTGGLFYYYTLTKIINYSQNIPELLKNKLLSGSDCFIELMEAGAYFPSVCNLICKTEWIKNYQLLFKEGIIHEDELWTPIALCKANKIILSDIDFYYYRQQEGSIMHTLDPKVRVESLFFITRMLIHFNNQYSFTDNEKVLKSWFYVNIYRLFLTAFAEMCKIKDSSFAMPNHELDIFPKICEEMYNPSIERCQYYYLQSKSHIKRYLDFRQSPWFVEINHSSQSEVIIILLYNTMWDEPLPLDIKDMPTGYLITTDRSCMQKAHAVVFHMPTLFDELSGDLDKPDSQIWVAWYMESEVNYPELTDTSVMDLFDLKMSYRQNADIIYPYYSYEDMNIRKRFAKKIDKHDKICMCISSFYNQSNRIEYIQELMKYTDVDSYGQLFNNRIIENDRGLKSKLELYSKYKFVIAFENSVCEDYVTEKFFDPLRIGSVPIYLGAPNIRDFAPGNNSFIDGRDFSSPKELATFINSCYKSNTLYNEFHKWRNIPLLSSFQEKVEKQRQNPFISLCQSIKDKLLNYNA